MILLRDTTTSELAQGGILWFDNLTAPDATLYYQLIFGITLLNIERGLGKNPNSKLLFGLKNSIQPGLILLLLIVKRFYTKWCIYVLRHKCYVYIDTMCLFLA